jgi:hypothetical protein
MNRHNMTFPRPISTTRRQELLEAYKNAAGDLHNFINEMPGPEGKDYPASTRYDDPWRGAVQDHVNRLNMLQTVEAELRYIVEDLEDQLDERKVNG